MTAISLASTNAITRNHTHAALTRKRAIMNKSPRHLRNADTPDAGQAADPVLAALREARDRRDQADHDIRILLAYARGLTSPRPYRLTDLAAAAGMSISGVRVAYARQHVESAQRILRTVNDASDRLAPESRHVYDLPQPASSDRLTARHHPSGRSATLGPSLMTPAAAAIAPELITDLGSVATADDTPRADFRRWEREFAADRAVAPWTSTVWYRLPVSCLRPRSERARRGG